jgi:hypothetical protein
MLVTLTGAFKNAGDYLIGHRARTLLASHTQHEIVDINRKALTETSYEQMNAASAVLLTGGPAYQSSIYPGVYDLDLKRVKVPIIAYGLGWKGKLSQSPQEFRFLEPAGEFVREIHNSLLRSSARDHLTIEMLRANGVENALMTGCPAWYDEPKLDQDYQFQEVKSLVFSMPAVPQGGTLEILRGVSKRFPKAKKYIAFNAGFKSTRSKNTAEYTRWNYMVIARATLMGFSPVSFEADFPKFLGVMSEQQLHLGYRVHSHLFSLSQRITSLLIAEDSRGVGQAVATGVEPVLATDSAAEVLKSLDELISSEGEAVRSAVDQIRKTHPVMTGFISQLATL